MISIYLDVPLNLKPIYLKIIDTISDKTYVLTENKFEANFIIIYPYGNNFKINNQLINNKNIKYINNFYKENNIFLFTGDYIKNSFLLMDYLYDNDYTYKKYLLYQLTFTNKNFNYLEKIIMLDQPSKWLVFNTDYTYQRIINNYHEIKPLLLEYNYFDNWRIQKILSDPAVINKEQFVIKCYVIFIKKGKKYETLFHKNIIIEINNKKYLAKNYFEYKKIKNYYYKIIYKKIIKLLIKTSNIYDKLFKPFYNLDKTTCYQILEYTFHLSSSHKLYINNINILPTVKWATLIYKINFYLFLYFKWGSLGKNGLIKISNNSNIFDFNSNNSFKNKIITFISLIFLVIFVIMLLSSLF